MKKKLLLTFILFSLIIASLPITATAANYKKAYRKVVNKFEKNNAGQSKVCVYDLIYINKDKKPELVCECKMMILDNINYQSYFEIYSFYSGKAKCSYWCRHTPASAYSMRPFYQPKKNVVGLRCWNQSLQWDEFGSLKNGKISFKTKRTYGRSSTHLYPSLEPTYQWIEGKISKRKILDSLS